MRADLQPMGVAGGSLAAHVPAAGAEAVERARHAAVGLRRIRVAHVSSAGSGGRVPELLGSLLPLAADAGLEPSWHVLFGDGAFSGVAGQLHHGLQGAESAIDDGAWQEYLDACARAAGSLPEGLDAVVLHDPGALGMAPAVGGAAPVAWRCHVDASAPDRPALERAASAFEGCASLVFPNRGFAPEVPGGSLVLSAAPGIDPLSARNLDPAPRLAGRVLRPLGVDLEHPFVAQVMRLDRWKDPQATVEAFALARERVPDLQLVLALRLEAGDESEWRSTKEVADYAQGREGVLLLTSYEGVGNLELGALQRLARVSLHRALREGFGLAASEALWKGTPVVGGADGGLPLQVRDGVEGYLTEGPEDTAGRVAELVEDPGLAIEMGRAGRERVRERFLITRALEEDLRALAGTLGRG